LRMGEPHGDGGSAHPSGGDDASESSQQAGNGGIGADTIPQRIEIGSSVVLEGLSKENLNGKAGIVIAQTEEQREKGRWGVLLYDGPFLSLKAENLKPGKKRRSDYKVFERIGEGAFSRICRCELKATGQIRAMKIIDKVQVAKKSKHKDVLMEKHAMNRLAHPNVLRLHDTFTDDKEVYLVYDFAAEGDLFNKIARTGCPVPLLQFYFSQICQGLSYMHSRGIVHRDLKCENILLNHGGHVWIADFGTAKDLWHPEVQGAGNVGWDKKRETVAALQDYVGTPQFMAPECVTNEGSDQRSDMWSMGCTIYQASVGLPPFNAGSESEIFERSRAMDLQFPPGLPDGVQELICALVRPDPEERMTLPHLMEHMLMRSDLQLRPVKSLAALCLEKAAEGIRRDVRHYSVAKEKALRDSGAQLQIQRLRTVHNWSSQTFYKSKAIQQPLLGR